MIFSSLILSLSLTVTSCGNDDPAAPENGNGNKNEGGIENVTLVNSNLIADLSTNKAVYSPGEKVRFTSSMALDGYKIRYRHGGETIEETDGKGTNWEWTAPPSDYTGYLVDIYRTENNTETVFGTIAVDVSSDWKRFPRYGFVATFDNSKLQPGVIEKEMEFLNRCHINGVQFQDWHYKHHWPLGGTPGNLMDTYTDIANREVSTEVVKNI